MTWWRMHCRPGFALRAVRRCVRTEFRCALLGAGLALLCAGQTLALEPIDDTDAGEMLRYSPGWTRWEGPHPRGGTLHYANQQGNSVELTFRSTAVDLLHKVGPDCGMARITVNGRPAAIAELDTYSPEVDWNRRTRLADGLPEGMTMAQMALRWILDHDAVSVVIPGASRAEQAIFNAQVSDLPPLPGELHAELRRFYEREVADHIRGPY